MYYAKEREMYYALKNALKELNDGFEYSGSILFLDDNSKTIDRSKSDQELLNHMDKAYDVLQFIRMTKQLGTAILKSIYQNFCISTINQSIAFLFPAPVIEISFGNLPIVVIST